jgi:hypothetical protein
VVFVLLSDMLLVMITGFRRIALPILAALGASGVLGPLLTQARPNPYSGIVERNPFGLKDPPPPPVETNQTAATPPVKVVLTGITSMFGPNSKRAFLEMTEQAAPGKAPAATPRRAMLSEGDREGDIEVVSINIEQNIVRIRNNGVESELTFEAPKQTGSATPANVAAAAPAVNTPMPATAGQPTIISSSEPRGGITMAGGGGSGGFQDNAQGLTSFGGSTPTPTGNFGGLSRYGGVNPSASVNPTASPASLASAASASGGLASIPSRVLRVGPQEEIDPAERAVRYELMREHYKQLNEKLAQSTPPGRRPIQYPPMPPSQYAQQIHGQ